VENSKVWVFTNGENKASDGEQRLLMDTIKAALLEELRFAKRQQWTVTAAVVALIGGTYTIASDKQSLVPWEKAGATILIIAVVAGGIYWLFDPQGHLYRTRLVIDRWDPDPWWRGTDLVTGMAGAQILSGAVVCYLLLRDGAYELLFNMLLLFAVMPML
jgi:hypothetical protein